MKNVLLVIAALTVILSGCMVEVMDSDEDPEIEVATQALTWQFESIERDDSGSQHTTYYMYTLDTPEGTVCGGAADYIVHFNRSGAHANRSKLRFDAESSGAGCLLFWNGNSLSSRVYDDNHVWVCAGKTRTDLCGGPSIFSGLKLWQVP